MLDRDKLKGRKNKDRRKRKWPAALRHPLVFVFMEENTIGWNELLSEKRAATL